MNLHRIQRGIPRTVQETIDEIKHRYELAITSTESAVKAAQTVSGVKGTIAQHWIAKIIQKRGDLVATYITSRETRDPRLNEGYRTGEHRATLKNSIMKGIEVNSGSDYISNLNITTMLCLRTHVGGLHSNLFIFHLLSAHFV